MDDVVGKLGTSSRKRSNSVTSVEDYRANELFSSSGRNITNDLEEHIANPGHSTPIADFFEALRLKLKKFMTHTRIGRFYENTLLTLSVVSCLEYIYQTYQRNDRTLHDLYVIELVFASIFAFDWCINCFLAEHRLIFFTSFFSMVDLLTVIPIFVTYGRPMPNVNYIYTLSDALLYMAYGMSTTRILRALRIRRKLAKIEDAVERFMGELTLSIIVMILFFASVMQFLEFTYQPNDYHTWMYYIWVTISTVGYGDITPISTQGRVAVMCIIGFSIISIPKMTNELIEKMALQSVYMRNTYTPKSKKSKHIVICGDISSLSLTEFFEELFHEDHENVDLNAIMLLPCPPTTEMIFLLRDSAFFLNLMYLEGSALIDKDLKRAKAQSAEAIFIMTNKFSNRPDEEDAKSILLNLSIKRYVASFHLPPQLFCLQLIRPSNRKHLGRDEGYNQVDELDLVVCLNEIKMGMLAKAVLYPGANTLLMNLISSFSDGEIADQEDDKSGGSTNWVNEYTQGCGWEIYTSQLSVKFEGESFANLSYKLYKKIGLILFALQITDSMGRSKLLLNPADYVIPVGQSQNVLAFVIAENKASSDLTFSSQPAETEAKTGGLLDSVLNRVQIVKKKLDAQGHDAAEWIADKSSAHSQYFAVDSTDEPPAAATKHSSVNRRSSCVAPGRDVSPTPIARTSSIDIVTSMSDANINLESRNECLIHLKETHFKRSYYTRETPISLKEATIKGSLVDVVPDVQNHLIIVGKGLSNLFDLIRPLRAKYLGTLRPIMILSPDTIEHDVWSRISMFDAVYFIRGSALEERNLRRAGIFKARRVVVLADGTADASSAAGSMAALVDSDAIFAYQRVRKMNPRAQVVIEIVNTSNIGYLYTPSHENADGLNAQIDPADIPTDYKFSQQFAAGELFTTSLLDSIVCQGYYNPHIISVIDKLISGSDLMARNEMLASFSESSEPEPTPQKPSAMMHGRSFRLDSRSGSQGDLNVPSFAGGPRPRLASEGSAGAGAEEVELSKLQGSCFYQIPLPDDMATRSYGSLYKRLSKKGIIPLGLLRGVASTSASFSSKAAPAPYVYTNPTFDTELNAGDRVFILSVRPISDNIEEEQPNPIGAHSTGINNSKPGTAPHRGLARTGTEDLTPSVMHHQLQQDFRDLSKDVNRKFEMIMSMLQGGQTFAALSSAPQTLSTTTTIIPEIAPRPAKFALSPLPPLKATPASTATVQDKNMKKNSSLSSERSAQALPQHEETKYEEPQQGTSNDSVAQDKTPPDSSTQAHRPLVTCTPGPAFASTYSPMVFTFPKARTRTRGGSIGLDPTTSTGSLTSEDPLLNSSPRQLDRKKPVSGAKPS